MSCPQINKNTFHKSLKTGFSLVELSIVLVVIGVLIVGVSQGYNLVRSAQISNARGITSKSPVGQTEGLIAWYESSLLDSFTKTQIYDGAQINEWKDISSYSYLSGFNKLTTTFTANLTFAQSAINKIPGIKFIGTSPKLNLANFNQGSTSASTIFMVFKPNYAPDTTNYRTILDNGTNSTYSISIKSDAVALNNGASGSATVSNAFELNKSYILATYFNGTNSQIYLNDALTMFGSSALSVNGSNQLNGLTIGNNFAGTAGFTGFISEVIIFNRVLKEAERKEIFYYLSKKYKITVNGI
ncbi:MAG: prepilin-type N-terminal cleavage/methylation domain-containing protein [Proteobacteria bacterium]|jgi:prepilin-type N-terminal cleavage/methylation domain-containing protein|nr:prepilin-type N-terminal cleavage/methylation domain-containing protein [Pseudomonadota bacterium]NCA28714.1 prepilin-type N-terminal cleavage/methylation domain-containing protein [Pseudomonadota bacterium]